MHGTNSQLKHAFVTASNNHITLHLLLSESFSQAPNKFQMQQIIQEHQGVGNNNNVQAPLVKSQCWCYLESTQFIYVIRLIMPTYYCIYPLSLVKNLMGNTLGWQRWTIVGMPWHCNRWYVFRANSKLEFSFYTCVWKHTRYSRLEFRCFCSSFNKAIEAA